ncbi:lysine N(6)-hydroxylase/L-ornithine N(5)-oxygenase family protein [Clavibacter sp. Sh2036]|uniref:lysine N(6)-hydroxylase/L-ornithine N(5)-oxygenase family protein n=1 Tax=Clavibacter sp. Sh2036 TaxID=3397677 RepID=UPI0039E030E5
MSAATSVGAPDRIRDVVAVGLGPANLGLACLADPLDLDLVVLERKPRFDWHPGMMLPTAHLQTPFLADLVTLADPTSRFSFLAYLKDTGRLYSFYIREDFFVLRSEYVAYCRWAAERARGIELDRDVRAIRYDEAAGAYVVESVDSAGGAHVHRGRNLVVGVGTPPWLPEAVRDLPGVVHSSGYLGAKDALQERDAITVVGSGQSAAEIYRDLLEDVDSRGYRLDWITRSPRFFPLEYTRLTLEMTSPEYSDHFFGLPAEARDVLLREQRNLYKGIDSELIDDVFHTLYRKRLAFDALRAEGRLAHGGDAGSGVPTRLLTNAEVVSSRATPDGGAVLGLRHAETGAEREWPTGAVIMASGYDAQAPRILDGLGDRVHRDARGRLDVAREHTVDDAGTLFVQNAEVHTHGFVAPDLGMTAHRNSRILRAITGRETYAVEERIAFQEFGLPDDAPTAGSGVLA